MQRSDAISVAWPGTCPKDRVACGEENTQPGKSLVHHDSLHKGGPVTHGLNRIKGFLFHKHLKPLENQDDTHFK